MKRSCFGVLRPTQKMSGLNSESRSVSSASSLPVSSLKGGLKVPTILSPGNLCTKTSLSLSATPVSPHTESECSPSSRTSRKLGASDPARTHGSFLKNLGVCQPRLWAFHPVWSAENYSQCL